MMHGLPILFLSVVLTFISSCLTLSDEDFEVSERIISGEQLAWTKDSKSLWPGLYSGYLYLGQSKKTYAFETSFIFHRYAGDVIKSKMIITALQGGYNSHEYSSEYFSFVDIYPRSGNVVVKGKSPVKFSNMKLNGKVLTGDIEVRGVKGDFLAVWNEKQSLLSVQSNGDIQSNLTGRYRGICAGKETIINLNVKKISLKRPVVNFLKMSVTGKRFQASSCDSNFCEYKGLSGTLDLAKETLELMGQDGSRSCKVRGKNGALDCDGCLLVRNKVSDNTHKSRLSVDLEQFSSIISAEDFNPSPKHEDLAGSYRGFLVSDQIGVSQPITLKISSLEENGKIYLKGISRHYWQNKINKFYTDYPFLKRRYKRGRSVIVFDGVSDGLLYITGTYKDGLVGSWFSKSSGLLGQVLLKKNVSWADLPLNKATSLISDRYLGENSDIKITMNSGVSRSHYDFFPNKLYGVQFNSKTKKKYDYFVAGVIDRRSGYFGLLSKKRDLTVGSVYENKIKKTKSYEIKDGHLVGSFDDFRFLEGRKSTYIKPEIEINDGEIKKDVSFEALLERVEKGSQISL